MKKTRVLTALVLTLSLVVAACGDDDPQANDGKQSQAGADAGLPDLDGRVVSIAIENNYLPFN